MANFIDRTVAYFSPVSGLRRAQARQALQVQARYSGRAKTDPSWRINTHDRPDRGPQRQKLATISIDLIRNTPLARQGQRVIANNVVGDGIIPKVIGGSKRQRKDLLERIETHFDTTSIDAQGRQNLYGIQRLVLKTVVASGEALVRRRRRTRNDTLALPFQLEVVEPEYLNPYLDGETDLGTTIREGIEYDRAGRRIAYHLFDQHPADALRWKYQLNSRRIPATDVIHVFDQDRAGQQRGISWYEAIIEKLQHLDEYDDAELLRQKIAACFTAFRSGGDDIIDQDGETVIEDDLEMISPGRVERLGPGETVTFGKPPETSSYGEFTKTVHRLVAAGLGITYESLTGDLRGVNFSSGRMGRMEMDRNVSAWQWLMMIPQFCQPLAIWTMEAYVQATGRGLPQGLGLGWVPPHRMMIDPEGEIKAMILSNRAGYTSRSHSIRQTGFDPERVMEEQVDDAKAADQARLIFDSDPRKTTNSGQLHPQEAEDSTQEPEDPPPGEPTVPAEEGEEVEE